MQSVFKAKTMHSDVDDKIEAVKKGLTEEQAQDSYINEVSQDSIVRGRVKIRNKSNNIVNYTVDPSGRAEQSVGAIR